MKRRRRGPGLSTGALDVFNDPDYLRYRFFALMQGDDGHKKMYGLNSASDQNGKDLNIDDFSAAFGALPAGTAIF